MLWGVSVFHYSNGMVSGIGSGVSNLPGDGSGVTDFAGNVYSAIILGGPYNSFFTAQDAYNTRTPNQWRDLATPLCCKCAYSGNYPPGYKHYVVDQCVRDCADPTDTCHTTGWRIVTVPQNSEVQVCECASKNHILAGPFSNPCRAGAWLDTHKPDWFIEGTDMKDTGMFMVENPTPEDPYRMDFYEYTQGYYPGWDEATQTTRKPPCSGDCYCPVWYVERRTYWTYWGIGQGYYAVCLIPPANEGYPKFGSSGEFTWCAKRMSNHSTRCEAEAAATELQNSQGFSAPWPNYCALSWDQRVKLRDGLNECYGYGYQLYDPCTYQELPPPGILKGAFDFITDPDCCGRDPCAVQAARNACMESCGDYPENGPQEAIDAYNNCMSNCFELYPDCFM